MTILDLMRGLIAINVVNNDVLYNKEHPLLMYYDGKQTIEEAVKSQREMHQYLIENVVSLSSWETASLVYMSYYSESDRIGQDEISDTGRIYIKDIIPFSEAFNILVKDAIVKAFDVYTIEEANNMGLSKPTILNGIRSVVLSSGVSKETCTSIIKEVQEYIR